jgi:hypothetical protein
MGRKTAVCTRILACEEGKPNEWYRSPTGTNLTKPIPLRAIREKILHGPEAIPTPPYELWVGSLVERARGTEEFFVGKLTALKVGETAPEEMLE